MHTKRPWSEQSLAANDEMLMLALGQVLRGNRPHGLEGKEPCGVPCSIPLLMAAIHTLPGSWTPGHPERLPVNCQISKSSISVSASAPPYVLRYPLPPSLPGDPPGSKVHRLWDTEMTVPRRVCQHSPFFLLISSSGPRVIGAICLICLRRLL